MIGQKSRNFGGRDHPRRNLLRAIILATGAFVLAAASASGAATPADAGSLPPSVCDIQSAAGNDCVAAYSSVRALYSSYNGPLYQVQRSSDANIIDIGVLSPGGYANAAAQDAFCANTVCIVTKIYDQSPRKNDLTPGPVGQAGSADYGVRADALPIVAGGHAAYGIMITPGTGYRHMLGDGVATGSDPETMYAVLSASNIAQVDRCCSSFGNAEAVAANTGSAHMDALNLSSVCTAIPCQGTGPWFQADLENATFMGAGGPNPNNISMGYNQPFVTGVLRNDGSTKFALDGGSSNNPTLASLYSGALPPGYSPMQKEGGIILGIGGDNSNAASGSFFEGTMTRGYASDQTVAAIAANIASVGYQGTSGGGPGSPIVYPKGGQCVDVAGDDNGGDGAAIQIWTCQHDAVDQRWTPKDGLVTGPMMSLGRCMDVKSGSKTPGTEVQLYTCNGDGAQVWQQQANGTLLNPQSGLCLTSPGGSTTDGTHLVIDTCAGSDNQKFWVSYPYQAIGAPGGQCLDVAGTNNGGNGANVGTSACVREEVDQMWRQSVDGSLVSLGRCLDIKGNATTAGTEVELWDCNGLGGQKWVQQTNGTLLNPQSGLCLNAPTAGVVATIQRCTGAANQQFSVSGGHPITAPGGKCIDVVGDDQYGDWFGIDVQLWDCTPAAADQHWTYHPEDNTLRTLTRCLDVRGNSSTPGTGVELYNCNGVGGQKWIPQADGTLLNPQSGLCLNARGSGSSNGTILEINACTGSTSEQFGVIPAISLAPGTQLSLRATTPCCTTSYIRHQNGAGALSDISATSTSGDKTDATWIARAGLADSTCVSFESKNYPNGYLYQSNGQVFQDQNDGTTQFATNATFCPVPGKNGGGVSLSWFGDSSKYLRHYYGKLYVASSAGSNAWDGGTSWTDDVSWAPTAPWVA